MEARDKLRILIVLEAGSVRDTNARGHVSRLTELLLAEGHEVVSFEPRGRFARMPLRRLAHEFRPDVVHVHAVSAERSTAFFAAAPRAARVLTIRPRHDVERGDASEPGGVPRSPMSRARRAFAIRGVDLVIALTIPVGLRLRDAGFRAVDHIPDLPRPGPGVAVSDGDAATTEDLVGRTLSAYRYAAWLKQLRLAARERPLFDRFAVAFGKANRRRKAGLITSFMKHNGVRTVLLVGVGQGTFEPDSQIVERAICQSAESVVAIDLHPAAPGPWRYLRADARRLPFADGSFDLVVSNAVIEHVGGESDQRAFVAEHGRVARAWVITTPNRWFPVEAHTRVAFRHWSAAWRRDRPEFTRLLSLREFRALLPSDATLKGSILSATFLAASRPIRPAGPRERSSR